MSPLLFNIPQSKPLFFSLSSPNKKARKKPSSPAKKKPTSLKHNSSLQQSKVKPYSNQSDEEEEEEEEEIFHEEIDFPYESPPLICCFGAAQREFLPTVRVSDRQMHPDQYSSWKGLQWNPPEFVRAPGGPPSNVAISHVRLGGRAAFMGKVGDDDYGNDMVYGMNAEKVQTRAVKVDADVRTAVTHMRIRLRDDGDGRRVVAETVRVCAEDSFLSSEIDVGVLKEVLNWLFLLS